MKSRSLLTGVPEALIGVFIFSLTMPAMRLALQGFDPVIVGPGRTLIAAVPAAILLLITGSPRLSLRQVGSLMLLVACLVFGFPWLCALALQEVPSYHAAIVIGGIPLATALFNSLRTGQRQPALFWIAALAGSALVASYGFLKSGGQISHADLILLAAAAVCGFGYTEGARLSREIGTRTLTCWMPVAAAPFTLLVCLGKFPADWAAVSGISWAGLIYNGLFSVFIGMLFWYRGLNLGGVARIGQLQLIQPFFSLGAAVILLHEKTSLVDWISAVLVVTCIAATQMAAAWQRAFMQALSRRFDGRAVSAELPGRK